jgi:hypothetical protein
MSCCGSRRSAFRPASTFSARTGSAAFQSTASTVFEYTGHTHLAVTGPVTGLTYRFDAHGQRLPVHGDDAASLHSVPSLKAVR